MSLEQYVILSVVFCRNVLRIHIIIYIIYYIDLHLLEFIYVRWDVTELRKGCSQAKRCVYGSLWLIEAERGSSTVPLLQLFKICWDMFVKLLLTTDTCIIVRYDMTLYDRTEHNTIVLLELSYHVCVLFLLACFFPTNGK